MAVRHHHLCIKLGAGTPPRARPAPLRMGQRRPLPHRPARHTPRPSATRRPPGPHPRRLLGSTTEASLKYEHEMRKACDRIKPGWVRVNFNYFYFIEDEVSDFILQAVEMAHGAVERDHQTRATE